MNLIKKRRDYGGRIKCDIKTVQQFNCRTVVGSSQHKNSRGSKELLSNACYAVPIQNVHRHASTFNHQLVIS